MYNVCPLSIVLHHRHRFATRIAVPIVPVDTAHGKRPVQTEGGRAPPVSQPASLEPASIPETLLIGYNDSLVSFEVAFKDFLVLTTSAITVTALSFRLPSAYLLS